MNAFAPLIFSLAGLMPAPTPTPAPQVARVDVSPNSDKFLGFEWDGLSIDGMPHQVPVLRVVLLYTNPLLAASTTEVIIDMQSEVDGSGGTTTIPMKDALQGVAKGDWDCQVALEDVAGQRGPFSIVTDQTRFTVHVNPPSAAKNVGVVDS